jgi:phosphoglycolate phosphatase-like HAD superfamily hydrolase
MSSALKALFFDQDGVIAETERDGHRVAFNKAFSEFNLGFQWNVQEYGNLLFIGGGKERLLHYLNVNRIGDASERPDLVETVHRRKTEIFIEIIENGELPPRPGVRRLMSEAKEMGLTIGICTTSQERSAMAVRNTLLKDIPVDFVLAGDVVTRKKPDSGNLSHGPQ